MRTGATARRLIVFFGLTLMFIFLQAPATYALEITPDAASIHTAGGLQKGIWNLWSNGEFGEFVRCDKAGSLKITVVARGSIAGDVWPIMWLSVNDEIVAQLDVGSNRFTEYTFEQKVEAGIHRITVVFLNNTKLGNEDRNLYIARMTVTPGTGRREPRRASVEEWRRHVGAAKEKAEEKVLAQSAAVIEKHRKGDAVVRVLGADGKPLQGAAVSAVQVRHNFLFGCNIFKFNRFKTPEHNALFEQRFRELFNYATTAFYWRPYERVKGKPAYVYTDRIVAWCQKHGIRLKGHPLLSHNRAGTPIWADGQFPPPEARKQRVHDIITRFGHAIEFWEVVNEPSHHPGLTIDDPYRWARAARPKAYLIVNDFSALVYGYPPFFELLVEAQRRGVPFDGIGIQAHEPRTMRFPLDRVRRYLDRYAQIGKDLHITEFTPTSSGQPITGSHRHGPWNEAAQAEYAVRFYTVCFGHPAVKAITWWDLCDQGAWLEGGGLLRADLSPKPAYVQLKDLIQRQWKTRCSGTTNAAGELTFRGFYGTYQVSVEVNGSRVVKEFHLEEGKPNVFSIP